MAILISGATGIVGCELVAALLRVPAGPAVYVLVRGDRAAVAAKERWLRGWLGPAADDRLVVEFGDCAIEGFGVSGETRRRIAREVTAILHAAANTSFDLSASEAFATNVVGTRNAMTLARSVRHLERFGFLSSAYIAGPRSGVILEDAARTDMAFDNEYERSKATAETEVLASGLPAVAYRLSIVLGRSTDGVVSRLNGGPYLLMRLLHDGLIGMYPAAEGQTADMLPVDFVARAVTYLFCDAGLTRPIYHVCAGREAITTTDFYTLLLEALAHCDPDWTAQGFPAPLGAPLAAVRAFRDTVELVAHSRLRAVVRRVDQCMRPLDVPKTFDTRGFTHDLAPSGLAPPSFRSYFPRVVGYAARNHFRMRPLPWEP